MKIVNVIGLVFLGLILGTAAPASAAIITGTGVVANTEVDDWFFSTTGAGVVTISVTPDPGGAGFDYDPHINLLTWDGVLDAGDWIANDDDGGAGLDSLIVTALGAGNYVVRVGTHSFSAPGIGATNPGGHHGDTRYQISISGDFVQAAAAVPEPASMLAWSLIVGVGAVGYRLRKRKPAVVA